MQAHAARPFIALFDGNNGIPCTTFERKQGSCVIAVAAQEAVLKALIVRAREHPRSSSLFLLLLSRML